MKPKFKHVLCVRQGTLIKENKQNANRKFDASRWTPSSVTLEMYGFYRHFQNGPIFEINVITKECWQHLQLIALSNKCAQKVKLTRNIKFLHVLARQLNLRVIPCTKICKY